MLTKKKGRLFIRERETFLHGIKTDAFGALLPSPCHSVRMAALLLLAVMDVVVLLHCLELQSEHCTFSKD